MRCNRLSKPLWIDTPRNFRTKEDLNLQLALTKNSSKSWKTRQQKLINKLRLSLLTRLVRMLKKKSFKLLMESFRNF